MYSSKISEPCLSKHDYLESVKLNDLVDLDISRNL